MVTVLSAQGFRFVIFLDDHEPAHVHVFGDGHAKISLVGTNAPTLILAKGMTRGDIRRALKICRQQHEPFSRSGKTFMADIADAEIDAALARGEAAGKTEPRARAACYDRRRERVIVDLTNGCTFAFPPRLAEGLDGAAPDQLAAVDVLPTGYGLRWPSLDVDLSVPGLLAGIFGTAAHMARLAGRTTSPAKAAAARANGKKGGRPRKPEPGDTAATRARTRRGG